MKKYISSLFIALSIALGASAQQDSLPINIPANGASIAYSTKSFVYDAAKLFNPTLNSKYEKELSQYKEDHKITIRAISIAPTDSAQVDERLKSYLRETNDVVILVVARQGETQGKIHIATGDKVSKMITDDNRRALEARINTTWLAGDNYESALIEAVDSIKAEIKDYKQFERNPNSTIVMIIGVIILAIVLYKFSTASFRDSKKKMRLKEWKEKYRNRK